MHFILLTEFIILLIVFLFFWRKNHKAKLNNFLYRCPEPKSSLPILGVALDFSSTKVIMDVLQNYVNSYGPIVHVKIGPFVQALIISDYELIEKILISPKMLTKSFTYNFLHSWLGTGLLTSDGIKWKKHRRLLIPAFHFEILKQFIKVFEKNGNVLIKKLNNVPDKNNIDIYRYVTLCSLDVICETIMGDEINAQEYDQSPYVQSVKTMCKIIVERSASPIASFQFAYPFTRNYWTERKALKILHKQSENVITRRQETLSQVFTSNKSSDNEEYVKNKRPFLDLLLNCKTDKQSLTKKEIQEEVDTFMFAGHDTTSSAMSFILYALANNSEPQEKAFKEQQSIFQNKSITEITYADLQSMKYLECVIKESLRLYPPVPYFARKVVEDFQYENNVIPKGVTLGILAFAIHRNPHYYENPDQFIPERFENANSKFPYAFIPFSAGPRNCIGQKFAMLEMKSIVSKILRNFELMPALPEHKLHLFSETVLKSSTGIQIRIKTRNSQ